MQAMAQIRIDPVAMSEASALAQIGRATFEQTFAAGNNPGDLAAYLDRAFSLPIVRAELAEPGSRFFFARVDGTVAGYLKLNFGDAQTEDLGEDACEVERLYVCADAQGTGLGKALFDFAMAEAKRASARSLWLGVWEDNPKAIAFYERQGFIRFGEHSFTIGSDVQRDLLMRIALP